MNVPALKCKAGHCTCCGRLVWRACIAAKNDLHNRILAGTQYLLWPQPGSLYARVQDGENIGVGVAFCPGCAPPAGTVVLAGYGPVIDYEIGRERYADRFTDAKGLFYSVWLRDAMSLPPEQHTMLMNTWKADRG